MVLARSGALPGGAPGHGRAAVPAWATPTTRCHTCPGGTVLLHHSTVRLGTAQPGAAATTAAPVVGRRARSHRAAVGWARRYSLALTVFEVLAAAAAGAAVLATHPGATPTTSLFWA